MVTFVEKTDSTSVDAATPPEVRTRYGPAALVDVCEEGGGFVVEWVLEGPRRERGHGQRTHHGHGEAVPEGQRASFSGARLG
jgi:hypothetical protein